MAMVGLETALHFAGPAIDGPFQLYNALRRIAAGQHGGTDFQFFHGLGLPYLHYLPFKLLGGTFAASEVTRQLVSVVLYPLTLVVVLRVFIKDWTRVAAWAAILMAVSVALRMTSVLIAVNSLLGVRSTMPVVMPLLLCFPVARVWRVLAAGAGVGLSLLLGSEQGLALIVAIVVATAVVAIRGRNAATAIIDGAAMIGIGTVTLAAALMMIGGIDGMRASLAYNFRLVPMDQYWYFGSPPNRFLSRWSVVPEMLMSVPRIPLALLAGVVAVVACIRGLWRAEDVAEERERFSLTVLTVYGLVSCASLLGSYVQVYVEPLLRVLLLVGAVRLDRAFAARDVRLGRTPTLGVSRLVVPFAGVAITFMLTAMTSPLAIFGVTLPHFIADHVIKGQGGAFADMWPQTAAESQRVLDAHRTPDGKPPTLWSTYAGLLEARNGLFHPSFDYIIHALGPENRARYVDDFRRLKPTLVQTVSPTYTPYEAWIEATSWDFYSELLQHYRLMGATPWSLFWERLEEPGPSVQEVWSSPVAPGATSIELPAPPGNQGVALLEVELFTAFGNPLRFLPVVGALPRYLVSIENAANVEPVSLDPYVASSRFPVFAYRGQPVRLSWDAYSLLPGARVEVSRVRVSFVPVMGENARWLGLVYSRAQRAREPEAPTPE